MSDKDITAGDVHKIVAGKLKDHKDEVNLRLSTIEKEGKESSDALSSLKVQATKIEGKLDAIYGNGSGRKGILDRLEDKQDASDKKVFDLDNKLDDESNKQASFRHDIRNQLETMALNKQIEENKNLAAKKDKYAILKWVLTGAAIVAWTFISQLLKNHHWLGF